MPASLESASHSNMQTSQPLKLFEAYGVEIEYMIVDRDNLAIRPLADKLLTDGDGVILNDLEQGKINWSNELAMHIIEFNFTNPEKSLKGKAELIQRNIIHANSILKSHNAMLLPTGMHPFLNPETDKVKLWSYDAADIYNSYDKIFNCNNHGWINVQSTHLNLPFSGDDEFRKLHSAIRFILPIIPALAASSPIYEGKISGLLNSRLYHYQNNQKIIPEIGAYIIPEVMDSADEYKTKILNIMYKAISRHDPDGILQNEWLNSRGAIPRFDRSSIEIRLIDTQECATADFAILDIVSRLVKWLIEERIETYDSCHDFNQDQLVKIFNDCIKRGDETIIENREYLKIFNLESPVYAREVWRRLIDLLLGEDEKSTYQSFIREYCKHGTLASRILKSVKSNSDKQSINEIYHRLSRCLADNTMFSVA